MIDAFIDRMKAPHTPTGPIVFVGVNGSGKTRYLLEIRKKIKERHGSVVYIPALRHLQASPSIQEDFHVDRLNLKFIESIVETQHVRPLRLSGSTPNLSSIVSEVASGFQREDRKRKAEYVSEVTLWLEMGEPPPKPTPPVKLLDEFLDQLSTVSGYSLGYRKNDGPGEGFDLIFKENGETFPLTDLSDGEKQILMFVVLLLQAPMQTPVTFIVDEPELHLNEARAVELWESIEQVLPNVTFVYATHSMTFATRSSVEELYLIEKSSAPVRLNPEQGLPADFIKDMVGARIQIKRSAARPVFCEDQAQKALLADLLHDQNVQLSVAGNWETVKAATASDRAYAGLVSGLGKKCGVIDRDFWTEESLSGMASFGVFALPFSEAESVVLLPDIAMNFFSSIDPAISLDDYIDVLCEAAQKSLPITLEKLKKHVESHSQVSLEVVPNAKGNLTKVLVKTSDSIIADFESRASALYRSIDDKNPTEIIKHFKGKELYKHVKTLMKQHKIDLPNKGDHQYKIIRMNGSFRNTLEGVPELAVLRNNISSWLNS